MQDLAIHRVTPSVALGVLLMAGLLASSPNRASGEPQPFLPLPPEKQAVLDRENRLVAEATLQVPPAKDLLGPTPLPQPDAWPTGILPYFYGPFSSSVYEIENKWQGLAVEEYVQVFAGALVSDMNQGILVLTTTPIEIGGSSSFGDAYNTPTRSGSVRIHSVDGMVLRLVSSSGTRFIFDVLERRFL